MGVLQKLLAFLNYAEKMTNKFAWILCPKQSDFKTFVISVDPQSFN